MQRAISETNRRRLIQEAYNQKHGITPISIKKNIQATLRTVYEQDYFTVPVAAEEKEEYVATVDLPKLIGRWEKEMRQAAKDLDFERAAELRDKIRALRQKEMAVGVKVE
jgi:excinuclease ABC subunit B